MKILWQRRRRVNGILIEELFSPEDAALPSDGSAVYMY
jgi:hypothetical protein